jgi:hypothetical protein
MLHVLRYVATACASTFYVHLWEILAWELLMYTVVAEDVFG